MTCVTRATTWMRRPRQGAAGCAGRLPCWHFAAPVGAAQARRAAPHTRRRLQRRVVAGLLHALRRPVVTLGSDTPLDPRSGPPPCWQARCLTDVADLFRALDHLLHDVDPEGVCQVAEFCPVDDGGLGGADPPRGGAAAELAGALRALATGGPAARVAGPGAGAASNDLCQNCKTIVMEAAAILQVRSSGAWLNMHRPTCTFVARAASAACLRACSSVPGRPCRSVRRGWCRARAPQGPR